ncbi:MAG: tetratricopeptide repeat protein, partial [Deltaproteobacteria bacterium]|nr:tetratricopeptide repeat protein [Deltaproteobacteria bacterium]
YGGPLGRPDYAIPYYQQALALDPGNADAMRQMADLYRATQQWAALRQVLVRLIDIVVNPKEKAKVLVELGDLLAAQFNAPEQARSHYEQALEKDPESIDAMEALEQIRRKEGDWAGLASLLRSKARVLGETEAKVETILNLAEIYEERLDQPNEAIACFREVVELEPFHPQALEGLARLYERTKRWADLIDVLERQHEVASSDRERVRLLMRVAALWEEEFRKFDRAAERLERVLEIDPTEEAAYQALERVYRSMQDWVRLIETLERHVAATPDRAQKQELLMAIGEVYASELRDLERAIDAYLNVTAIDPDNTKALDALARLYEQRGEDAQALEIMNRLVDLLSEPSAIVSLRYRMGRLLEERLGDRFGAIEQYERAIDIDPGHLPSLEALRRLYLASGDWLAAAKTLEQEIAHQKQARVVARLWVELGHLYEQRLDEPEKALECYQKALENDPDNEDAAIPLAEDAMKRGDAAKALPLLDMLVKRSGKRPPEEQHRFAFLLGQAALQAGHPEQAVKALGRAHQLFPQDLPTLLALARAHFEHKGWEQAHRFYQMILAQYREALSPEELADVHYRIGVIKKEQGEGRKALLSFEKALDVLPSHRPSLEGALAIHESAGNW